MECLEPWALLKSHKSQWVLEYLLRWLVLIMKEVEGMRWRIVTERCFAASQGERAPGTTGAQRCFFFLLQTLLYGPVASMACRTCRNSCGRCWEVRLKYVCWRTVQTRATHCAKCWIRSESRREVPLCGLLEVSGWSSCTWQDTHWFLWLQGWCNERGRQGDDRAASPRALPAPWYI